MQNEDDLRGLAKVMDFMRAISILFVVINIYWFCYQSFREWGINIGVVDKILLNFQRTAGLFSNILYTKLFSVVFLALSCLGTKGVKEEKITWNKIYVFLTIGFILFFLNWWLLVLPLPLAANTGLYIFTMTAGYLSLLAAGVWISRLLKNNLMDDVFNLENESFAQETRLIENEYSINLPTRFYYKKKWNDGWINVVNPFRASMVLGTPGSGKSYAIVNNYIKQQIEKGFAVYIYDYKFPDLSEIAYNHLISHLDGYKVKPKFYMINFDDPRKSHRCNPINPAFMTDISDAYEASYTIMLNLNRSWITKQGDFFVESPIILLASIIWIALYFLLPFSWVLWLTAALVIVFTFAGIWAADKLETYWGEDPSRVVVDEMVGVWIPLLAVPNDDKWFWYVIAAFALFRIFDIAKLLGIRRMESLKGGVGVMMDDVLAGVYSFILLVGARWVIG